MRNTNEEPIGLTSAKHAAMDFERELLYAFRGEVRKVNEMLPAELQSTGTAFRIAASAIGHALMPQSEIGKSFLERYLKQRPAETLYSPVGLGIEAKKAMPRARLVTMWEQDPGSKRKCRPSVNKGEILEVEISQS